MLVFLYLLWVAVIKVNLSKGFEFWIVEYKIRFFAHRIEFLTLLDQESMIKLHFFFANGMTSQLLGAQSISIVIFIMVPIGYY